MLKYENKKECVNLFIEKEFSVINSEIINLIDPYYDATKWLFSENDEKELKNMDMLPDYNFLFVPKNNILTEKIKKNSQKIYEDCGFWVIENNIIGVMLGIEYSGISSFNKWEKLYDLLDMKWHDIE